MDENTLALSFFTEHFITLIDRNKRKELRLILIPGFVGQLWGLTYLNYPNKKRIVFLKDDKHIF